MKRTPEQIAAVETLAKRICVDAGAGSGKTSVLIDRIVHLIEWKHATLDEIAAITFTEKAAAEMKIRLREAFRAKAPKDDPAEMSRWRDMERRVETSRINTIHSFCASLLRENALRMGFDPDFTVLAEAEATLLRVETVTDAVHALLEHGDEAAMRAATEFGTQRLINLMGYLLGRRGVLERIRLNHPLDDLAALVADWRRLEQQAMASTARDPEICRIRERLASFEGQCRKPDDARELLRLQVLASLERLIGAEDPSEISALLDELGAISFKGGSKKNWDPEDSFEAVRNALDEVRSFARENKPAHLDEVEEMRAAQITCDVAATFEKVREAYQQAKTFRSGRDFDDLLTMALDMLRENEEIRARAALGIKFLLIDEFQDTDTTQMEIARLLVEHPGGPALFVVGDAKQSIYDFRGAEVEVFQEAKAQAAEIIRLARNFRTVPEVLALVNDLFKRSGLLHSVEPEYVPLEVHRSGTGGRRIEFLIPEEVEDADKDEYRVEEAKLIAWRLDDMCRGASRVEVYDLHAERARPADFGDVALLFRSMSSVHLYEAALRERDVPYNVVAGAGFYERQEIIDLRNLLTVLIDPHDEMALLGFLRGPLAGLSDESLALLCNRMGLVDAMRNECPAEGFPEPDRLAAARGLLDDLRAHVEMPLPAFLRYALDRTGYEAISLTQFLGVQKAYNVRKIVDLADDFTRTRPAKLAAFVQYLDQIAGQEEIREGDAALQPEGSGAVTLMTIHKSKGLEFPIVVIPDLSRERRGPDPREVALHRTLGMAARITNSHGKTAKPAIYEVMNAAAEDKDAAEHARVLYVAMTRARDWLLMGGSPKPGKKTWLSTLDGLYGIVGQEHGGVLSGEDWSAVVYRQADTQARSESVPGSEARIEYADLARRAEPIADGARTRRVFSVTELLDFFGGEFDADDTGVAPGTARDPLLRGTLVHRLFELWPFDKPQMDLEALIDSFLPRECPSLKVREQMARDMRAIAERFQQSDICRRIMAAGRVQREQPFTLRVDGALVNGIIDALLEDGTLIDYKTGQPRKEKQHRYEWQLRLYAAAVTKLLGKQSPAALVYYADTGENVEVDVSPPRLEEALTTATEAIAALDQGCAVRE